MPYGRGGAGNIQAVDQANSRAAEDIEANQQTAESFQKGTSALEYLGKEEQQHAHTGRGGMGNYYSPRQLSETGHFNDAHRSHILGDGTLPPADSTTGQSGDGAPPSYNTAQSPFEPTRKVGRGGAGNIAFGVSEDEARAARKRLQEQQAREKLKADIEQGVEESLAMPQKAKLPGAEPY